MLLLTKLLDKQYFEKHSEIHSEHDYDVYSSFIATCSPCCYFTEGNTLTGVGADTYNASAQMTKLYGKASKHNTKGNLTGYYINNERYTMTYDVDKRIRTIKAGRCTVSYRYDALGRRVIYFEWIRRDALIWWGSSECSEHLHRAGQAVIPAAIMSHPSRLNAVVARVKQGSKFKMQWYYMIGVNNCSKLG